MGLRIGTNVQSQMGRHRLESRQAQLDKRFEHLATGKRIAKAADDASGTAISGRLGGRLRSQARAAQNAEDGLSLLQTAEGGLSAVEDLLVRMRELAVQSANGTQSNGDRDAMQAEFDALRSQIDQIANGTTYNRIDLLTSGASLTLTVGEDARAGIDTIDLTMPSIGATMLGLSTSNVGSARDPSASMAALDSAIDAISSARTTLGSAMNRLESAATNTRIRNEMQTSSHSRIVDTDVARETALLTRDSVIRQSAIAALVQANAQPELAAGLLA